MVYSDGFSPDHIVGLDSRPVHSHRVKLLATGSEEAAQLEARGCAFDPDLSRASASRDGVVRVGGEPDESDARVAVALAPVSFDPRDVLALAHRERVRVAATAAVVQGLLSLNFDTNAVHALAGADRDGLDHLSRGHQRFVVVLLAMWAAEGRAQSNAVFDGGNAGRDESRRHGAGR